MIASTLIRFVAVGILIGIIMLPKYLHDVDMSGVKHVYIVVTDKIFQ